jgi:hypothetical protein
VSITFIGDGVDADGVQPWLLRDRMQMAARDQYALFSLSGQLEYTDDSTVTKKRSITAPPTQSSRQNAFLEFPPFHHNILLQSLWDARDHAGRIKLVLSEQLVQKTDNPGELDFGYANDIVCFAFQHAPRGE